jgi:CspA family cold shock protein
MQDCPQKAVEKNEIRWLCAALVGLGATGYPRFGRTIWYRCNGPRAVGNKHLSRIRRLNMALGIVRWFNCQRGFGFIQPEKVGNDVFVDIGAVERAGMHVLSPGQRVSYQLTADRGTGGSSADGLRLV